MCVCVCCNIEVGRLILLLENAVKTTKTATCCSSKLVGRGPVSITQMLLLLRLPIMNRIMFAYASLVDPAFAGGAGYEISPHHLI